ncbi:MerR family DNA-binding transcriptional regulator [Actinotalea sp. BY-33]|uniref:MerR family DNA-binding transcriptional regulator n=1 Tax=Actinotalea soli TaxID=2819234 RepID=A0A939RSY4_9CELL|nr:MerR family DNA-binding transcriptional regulator [Actinotalea soli]
MRIGELAASTGVSPRSLRYYEQQGLITSARTPAGHRRYDPAMVDAVIRVQELFAAGLCSSKIASLLPCLQAPQRARTPALLADLLEQRARLDAAEREIRRARQVLDEVIDALDD